MTNELVIHYPTGATLYAMLFDATGQVYDGSMFAAPDSANWTDYDIAMSEVATATGIYRASMPAVAGGSYGWVVRKRAGASPAVSDIVVGGGSIRWTGTAEEAVPASVDVGLWRGEGPETLDGGKVQAAVSSVGSVGSVVNANVVRINNIDLYRGVKSSVSGNTITVVSLKNSDGTSLQDDNDSALVGWTAMFSYSIASIPPANGLWSSAITAHTTTSVTLADMPAHDLSGSVFTVYILPPAGGGASVDQQDVADALLLAPSGSAAAGSAMAELAGILAAGAAGSGAVSFPVTINDEDGDPIDGVEVWITTDSAGTNVVAGTLSTDASGLATFMLDAGTYYLWRQKSGYNFTNPVTIVVS